MKNDRWNIHVVTQFYHAPYPLPMASPLRGIDQASPPAGAGTGNTVVAESTKPGRLNLPLRVNGTVEGML